MQLSPKQYAQAWYQLLKDAPASRARISKRMLAHLYRNNRLSWLAPILRAISELERAHGGVERVVVRSAREMSASQARALVREVMGDAGAVIARRQDPELIAGARIETKNSRWDLSLQTRLQALQKRLTA